MKKQDLVDLRNSIITALHNANDAAFYARDALNKAKAAQESATKAYDLLNTQIFTNLYNSLPE